MTRMAAHTEELREEMIASLKRRRSRSVEEGGTGWSETRAIQVLESTRPKEGTRCEKT